MSAKKLSKSAYFKILDILNFDKRYLKSIVQNEYLTILNLHRVSNDHNPFYPSLTPSLFDDLLKYIINEFNVITFEDVEKYKNSKKPNIILSFDDGFYDFLEYAVPILKKYNICVNLNVIPQCIESGKPVWDVVLGDFLNSVPSEVMNNLDFPGFNMILTGTNKSSYGLALTRYLKNRPKEERVKLWDTIEKAMHPYKINFTRMLNRNEIIEISKVHEIGVHSYSHESMGIETKEFFEEDFLRCKEYFDKTLSLPMNIYAFPSGSYKEYQLDFLEKNGIEHILLVNEEYSNNYTNKHNRFTYYADSKSEVKMRSVGFQR